MGTLNRWVARAVLNPCDLMNRTLLGSSSACRQVSFPLRNMGLLVPMPTTRRPVAVVVPLLMTRLDEHMLEGTVALPC